jgi:hypothetical protein
VTAPSNGFLRCETNRRSFPTSSHTQGLLLCKYR